ncbi:hypothetical protein V8J88_09530 [Massilia sp. W12]|uniref:hypothetical protein n=1 Tax=Massilia sp. W12 TaxID=3126507 RepID=UPI0030CC412C
MAHNMLHELQAQIYPYLILSGSTIGMVLWLLRKRAVQVNHLNQQLGQLNQQLQHEPLRFLQQAPALLQSAGLLGLRWRLEWYGAHESGEFGECKAKAAQWQERIEATEICIDITFFLPHSRGEQFYFIRTVLHTFILLLQTDFLIKAASTRETLLQMARMHLFLQHDMKNIAQFIQLMDEQLSNCPPALEQQLLQQLRFAAPLVRQRADHIVHSLTNKSDSLSQAQAVAIGPLLERLCRLHSLTLAWQSEHQASAWIAPAKLDGALDNILKNYYDWGMRQTPPQSVCLHAWLHTGEQRLRLRLQLPGQACETPLLRLFEPFWSSDEQGLGVGLYQARQMLQSAHGDLQAGLDGSVLYFEILLPAAPA